MTPQLVDHAHTDSCAVIGCYLMQVRRKMNMFISGRSHCEQRLPLRRRPSVVRRDIIIIYAPSVQRSVRLCARLSVQWRSCPRL